MVRGGELRWGLPQPSPSSPPLKSWLHPSEPPVSSRSPFSARSENNCFLYGVFNGYDGNRVTSFVAQRLSAELLLGQLSAEHTEADVRRVLLQVLAVRPAVTPRSSALQPQSVGLARVRLKVLPAPSLLQSSCGSPSQQQGVRRGVATGPRI